MRQLLLVAVLVACAYADADPTDVWCNYTARGDETIQNSVPIATFRTSGMDFERPQWCIAHCHDRKSLKAAMLFQPSSGTAPRYERTIHRMMSGKVRTDNKLVSGTPLRTDDDDGPNQFCIDPNVSTIADAVFAQYDTVETISEALNYQMNKQGWAYLVYQMGPAPSLDFSANVFKDVNFCTKTYVKVSGVYQLFCGLVQSGN